MSPLAARPGGDHWPTEQDAFWRGVKAELPEGTIVTVDPSAFGALEVSAWGPERIVAMQVPPSIVTDPPQAAALGRTLRDRLAQVVAPAVDWLTETEAAGVKPGAKLVFVLEYSGGGVIATVEALRGGIVFLSTGLRLRWAAVLGVIPEPSSAPPPQGVVA